MILVGLVLVGVGYAYFAPKSSEVRNDALPDGAAAMTVLGAGDWMGADSFHFARGNVTLYQGADGGAFLRFVDYAAREGPDVYFYLVRDANATSVDDIERDGVRISTARLEGTFNIPLPPGLDLAAFQAVVAWCDSFNTRFGTAVLEGPEA